MAESRRSKFSWWTLVGIAIIIGIIGTIINLSGIYYYRFKNIPEGAWAKYFYTWKKNFANISFKDSYKQVKSYNWNPKDEVLNNFIEVAQGGSTAETILSEEGKEYEKLQRGLLLDGYIEYFNRHPQSEAGTVYNDFDWTFLHFRKAMNDFDRERNPKKDENKQKVLDQCKPEIKLKNRMMPSMEWNLSPKGNPFYIQDVDQSKLANDKEKEAFKTIGEVRAAFIPLLKYLRTNTNKSEEHIITAKTEADKNELVKLTKKVLDTMGYKKREFKGRKTVLVGDLENKHVLEFWQNLGTVRSDPYEAMAYNRLFFIFYFHTTMVNPTVIAQKNKNKKAEKRINNVYSDFARIMAKGFVDPSAAEKPKTLEKFFAPPYDKEIDTQIKISDELFDEYLNALEGKKTTQTA